MSKLLVGAHCVVYINGRRIEEITSVRWDSATPHIARRGIDSLSVCAFDPVEVHISGTISVFRTHGSGGLQGRGIVSTFEDIPRQKYFSILIIDRFTGKRIHQADHCIVTNENWNIAAKQRVEGQFSFEAFDWSNELT